MKTKVAVFFEPSLFPGAEHFLGADENVAEKIPDEFQIVDAESLLGTDLEKEFDVLIMPFGGYYPLSAQENLLSFIGKGGDIVFLGGGPFSSPCRNENGKWRVHDPLDFGDRWRWSFVSLFTGRLGLSFQEVPETSGFVSEGFTLIPEPEFSEFFEGLESVSCKMFKGSLQPLYSGRKRAIATAPEGCSSAPSVREFLTLLEPGFSREVNGRFVCGGFLPDGNWTDEIFKTFLSGIVRALEADRCKKLEYALSLSSYISRKNDQIHCEAFPRNEAEARDFSLSLKVMDASGNEKLCLALDNDSGRIALPPGDIGPGVYSIELLKGSTLVNSSSFSILPERETPEVKVCRSNGYAAFNVNGDIIPAQIYAFNPYNRALDVLSSQFSEAGIHVHHFLYPLAFGWNEDGSFDWSDFDRIAERVLKNDPHALLYPRIFLTTPPWWDKANPEELKVFRNGNKFIKNFTLDNDPLKALSKYSVKGFNDITTAPSWESEKWMRDAAAALESFIRHTQKEIYRGNMLGYFLASGTYGEWIPMKIHGGLSWEDLSVPSLKSFRSAISSYYKDEAERKKKWKGLSQWRPEDIRVPRTNYVMKNNQEHHYGDSEQNLKDAADIPSAEIAHATPPNFVRRHIARYGVFRDPQENLDTLEYYRFLRESFSKIIAFFTSTVKRVSNGKSVTGIFSGSLMNEFLQDDDGSYHFNGFSDMLREVKDLDIATTPYNYYKRFNTPEADGNMRNVPGSMLFSDKIFISENDQRTIAGDCEYWWMLTGDKSPEETCEAIYRNFMICLSHHAGLWWYDFGKGWYDYPPFMQAISDCQRIYEKVLNEANKAPLANPPDSLNIIYSSQSYDYICACSKLCRANTTTMLQEHLNRTGFPWEAYFQEDLKKIQGGRAWLFLNTCALSEEEREYINANLKRDSNVIIWLYAAGLYKDEELSVENVSSLTGFNLGWSLEKTVMEVKITDKSHPMTAGLTDEDDKEFTIDYEDGRDLDCIREAAPEFFIDDPEAAILGVNSNTGRPAFGVKEFDNWTSVYIACPLIPKNVIRKVSPQSGASVKM